MVKSRNRLVGAIQNNDLYGDDDDYARRENEEMVHDEDCEGQVLDLGLGEKSNAPKKQFNFMNKAAVDASDLNAKIKQLGFIRDTNVNELAARGVNLSLRDEIIRKLQHDKKQAQEQAPRDGTVQAPTDGAGQADEAREVGQGPADGKAAVENQVDTQKGPSKQATLAAMVDKFCLDAKKLAPGTADVPMAEEPVDVDAADGSEDEGGLEFIDPEEVRKKQLAEAAANKDQNQKPKMVLINGVLVPASTVSLNKGPSHHSQAG